MIKQKALSEEMRGIIHPKMDESDFESFKSLMEWGAQVLMVEGGDSLQLLPEDYNHYQLQCALSAIEGQSKVKCCKCKRVTQRQIILGVGITPEFSAGSIEDCIMYGIWSKCLECNTRNPTRGCLSVPSFGNVDLLLQFHEKRLLPHFRDANFDDILSLPEGPYISRLCVEVLMKSGVGLATLGYALLRGKVAYDEDWYIANPDTNIWDRAVKGDPLISRLQKELRGALQKAVFYLDQPHVKFTYPHTSAICLATATSLLKTLEKDCHNSFTITALANIFRSDSLALLPPELGGCHSPIRYLADFQLKVDHKHDYV
jgi:hypothetical protein